MPAPKKKKAVDKAAQAEHEAKGPPPYDANRPSIADPMGRPPGGGGYNPADKALETNEEDWFASGVLSEDEIDDALLMLALEMADEGRLNAPQLVYQRAQLKRSQNGFGLRMFKDIATMARPMPMGMPFNNMLSQPQPDQQNGR